MMKAVVKVLNFRLKVCLIHLLLSIIIYCLIIGFGLDTYYGIMYAYGIYSTIIFASLLLSELRLNGLNILMIFYMGAFLRLTIPTIQMANDALNGETFSFQHNYTNYLFQCAVAMNIYYMLFILLIAKFAKDKSLLIDMSTLFNIKHINIFVIVVYSIGFIARLIPVFINFADTFRRFVSYFPTISILVLAFYCAYTNKKSSYRLFVILTIAEILYAILLGFFKGAIMIPLVIFLLYYYLKCKNTGKRLVSLRFIMYIGGAITFLFLFVYPFMETKRMESQWDPATNITYGDYNSLDIAMRVLRGEVKNESETASEAANSRQSALPVNTYFYMSAITHGYQTRILKPALRIPIPRWLGGRGSRMSDHQGYLATAWLQDGNFIVSEYGIHSASYVGAFASAFFWGGWPAAVLMCIFNSFVIVSLLQFCYKNSRNPFALLILLQLVTGALNCYEEIHDGGVSRAVNWGVMVILALIIKQLSNIFFHEKKGIKRAAI